MGRGLRVARERPWRFAAKALSVARPANAAVVARHAASLRRPDPWAGYVARAGGAQELERRADDALGWIARAQDRSGSGGIASFELYGWSTGYPEVTGYVIPTLWDWHARLGREELRERALRMAAWELDVQTPEGGWESGYHGSGRPPVVFNTGQVLRGLVRTYEETADERFLASARRGADWIVANQEEDGSWARANYRGLRRVYDSYVAAPLARLAALAGEERYADSARRSCEFVLGQQRESGWFALADNSVHFNDRPSTHTLLYTIDGLLETGALLDDARFLEAGRRALAAVAARVSPTGHLPGRFDERWEPQARWVCVPGSAQLGIALMSLPEWTGEAADRAPAERLADFLCWLQRVSAVGEARRGGLPGAYPIWAPYSPLTYPCWAAKYFLDLVLLLLARPAVTDASEAQVRGHA